MYENNLYIKCNLSKLYVRRNVHLRNIMFKMTNVEFHMENNDVMAINTRLHDGPVFMVTHPKNETIKISVMYAGAIEWNNLDAEVTNIEDFIKFKRLQKSWMLNTFLN